jgi:hypothetical protein
MQYYLWLKLKLEDAATRLRAFFKPCCPNAADLKIALRGVSSPERLFLLEKRMGRCVVPAQAGTQEVLPMCHSYKSALGSSLRWNDGKVCWVPACAGTTMRYFFSPFHLFTFQSPTIFQSFNLHSHKPLYPTHAADEGVCQSTIHQRSYLSPFHLFTFQSPTIFQSFNLHSHKPLYPTHAADEDVCQSTIHQRSYLFTLSPFHPFTFPSFNPSISIPINLCTLRTRQTRASAITTNHEDVCQSTIHQRSYLFTLSLFHPFILSIFQSFNLHSLIPLYPTHAADEGVCNYH